MTEQPAVSNPGGRPKGSKNKITLLKLMAEETARTRNAERMLQVVDDIISAALEGDRDCRKMVWSTVMSKSGVDHQQSSGELPQIVIRMDTPAKAEVEAPAPIPTPIEEGISNG